MKTYIDQYGVRRVANADWRTAAKRRLMLLRFAKLVRATNAIQKRFRRMSFANRGATFMRSKYFKSYHRKWGMKP